MTTSPACILVTDDDLLILQATCRLLESAGYEVISATTGEQTLQLAPTHHPDLLLLDVNLPDIQGTEVCRQLKTDPQTSGIFIILFSGTRTGSDDQSRGMEGGADGYITRPIANRELLARLQAYLRIKTAEQTLERYSQHLEDMVAERTHELQQAQEKLVRQEKLAVLGQMAGSVGHELRNPLGVINTAVYYLNLVLPEADEKVRQKLAIIRQEVANANKIIGDLLDFARIKSMDRQPVTVEKLVRQTLERFPLPTGVELRLDLPAGLPAVYADPRQLEQVLGNLVTNACQAMVEPRTGSTTSVASPRTGSATGVAPPRTGSATGVAPPRTGSTTGVAPPETGSTTSVVDGGMLSISARPQDELVAISVQDTGSGISAENMQKLFEPLFTTKTHGIGLGLPISQKLVEANGGRIEVESTPGKGSTFTLYLPVRGKA